MSSTVRTSGIYGLFRRDGEKIDPRDAVALGFDTSLCGFGPLMAGEDRQTADSVDRFADAAGCSVLVGEIDSPAELAGRLSLAPDTPAASLARAALARWGNDLPREMLGEWSLAHHSADGTLTLIVGATHRDRLFYAVSGPRIAVAPSLSPLARIDWIGRELDETAVLLQVGTSPVRPLRGDRTMLRRCRQVLPGSTVTIGHNGDPRIARVSALTEQQRFTGSHADALAAIEDRLRVIMRQLQRRGRVAPLLSGGLDSSLLVWVAAEEARPDGSPVCITDIAPPGSGLPDEAQFADLATSHLGLKGVHAWTSDDANSYRPSELVLAGANGPLLTNRHMITEANQAAAWQAGASALVNGTYGELTATAWLGPLDRRSPLRVLASRVYGRLRRSEENRALAKMSHIRLAQPRQDALASEFREAILKPQWPQERWDRELFGYAPGVENALVHPNEFCAGALRMAFPYRDVRLLRLFAGFPLELLRQDGEDRPIVRELLKGRLPDAIRLRRTGLPASPEHMLRLRRDAPAALARIPAFRKAGLAEWIDLDWLELSLRKVSARGPIDVLEANTVQLTTIFAEFLTWWRSLV